MLYTYPDENYNLKIIYKFLEDDKSEGNKKDSNYKTNAMSKIDFPVTNTIIITLL